MYRNKITFIVGFATLILLISGFSLVNPWNRGTAMINPPTDFESYQAEWAKVDSLIGKGLPQSALEIAESIFENAKNTANYPQFIKAVMYRIKLTADFEEEFMEGIVEDLNAEIVEANPPAKQLLHSILADIYMRYFQANRHVFYERTMVVGVRMEDMRTWDLNTLMNTVIDHYNASLLDSELLKVTNLNDYNVILDTAGGSKQFRPSLYDFLAHRAIDFYMNDESSITQPAYRFELKNGNDFSGTREFCEITYQSKDSLSLKLQAMLIFQDLLAFHQDDPDPKALIDVNLERLNFVHKHSIHPAKDSLYLLSLKEFESEVENHSSAASVSFAIATELFRKSTFYKALESETNRWDANEAKLVCEKAMKNFPDSEGAIKCNSLLQKITKSSFRVTTEMENIPKTPMLALLSYKNLSALHFRIVKLDYKEHKAMLREVRQRQELLRKYVDMPTVQEWSQTLPNEGDFQEHKAEIKLPVLDNGYYLMLAGKSDAFAPDSSTVSYQSFWVTSIGYISQDASMGGFNLYLFDRETGAALKDVKADLFYRTYDYNSRSYKYSEGGSFVSDEQGYFRIPPLADNQKPNSFFLELSTGDDMLVTEDRFYHSNYSPRKDRKKISTFIFTDRAIYRPGQTIYFKGIVLEKGRETSEIVQDFSTTIKFLDVNHQKVSELKVVTGEYGSYQGSFVVPRGLLNGRMSIKTESGSRAIQVEEYKRPGFEVVFTPVEGSYKLNENVTVSGNARAFAGNNVSNAEVSYRVVREVYYPWRYDYFRYFPIRGSMEIANGATHTDEQGKFFIEFEAIPDHSIAPGFRPAFRYTIYADVTDINNETQSAVSYVRVGSVAMQIELGIGEVENKEDFSSFPLHTTNLNGQPVPAKGTVSIAVLEEPDRLLREQLWQHPDVFVMEQEAFVDDFPYDSYMKENDPGNLKIKSEMLRYEFDSNTDSIVELVGIKEWNPGRYKIKVESKDEFGTDVEVVRYFILFSPEAKTPPINELNWFYTLDNTCEPGENARVLIGSGDKKVRVLYEVVHKEKVVHSEWLSLSKEQRLLDIPVVEEYRGGLKVNLLFVKHNRVFNNSFGINVPFTNKELDFEFITFRDKLLPGQEEEWSVKIKGKNGDQVAAEVLASMYDMSLDKFTPHNWNFNVLPSLYHGRIWNTNNAFHNTTVSRFFVAPYQHFPAKIQGYDQLNWFGFYYFGGNYFYRGRAETFAMQESMPGQAIQTDGMKVLEEVAVIDEDDGTAQDPTGSEGDAGMIQDSVQASDEFMPQVRRDFNETAFFYPLLKTDEEGNVTIGFKVPESLTRWKLMGLAHTKDLKFGQFSKEIVTQKELMVMPNPPRFFRQGDQLEFAAKVVNLSENMLNGKVNLKFFNAITMEEITPEILTDGADKNFSLEQGGSEQLSWSLNIPNQYDVITYRVVATSGSHSDGEEKPIPVLSNRMLVTESMPMPLKGDETKDFTFKKLVNSDGASSLVSHSLTLEFSSNPAWYAVQALPYMMEGAHESADNVFNRFYANAIAAFIVNSNPRIRQVFETWKNYTPDALLSNLEKNEELKSLVLNETPWVRDAQNETERKHRIALLFDINKMADEQGVALRRLLQKQSPGGGWPWFKGMPDSRYITQHIVTGFGHLKQLGVFDAMKNKQTKSMLVQALRYLDQTIKEDYSRLLESKVDLEKNHLSNSQIQYLYARSYFIEASAVSSSYTEAFDYYKGQSMKYWTGQGTFQKAMIALALDNYYEKDVPGEILKSLREHALYSDEMGMYWRDNRSGYFWYEAPIETQAMLIEAFAQVLNDTEAVEQMKMWLLKQKQTQDWKTPRATASAIYSLLLRGGDWLNNNKLVEITIGGESIDPLQLEDTRVEAGTGYFKTSWRGKEISAPMGEVTVKNENSTIAWGALYWQYFEDLDKITFAETPLKLDKQLFVKRNTATGPVLEPVEEGNVKTGDMIVVRIELRVDRDMEYVHMKDMRASALEPVNVLSGYRYQGGLGYYESTLDASTNFFFDQLRKGTYVFEYVLIASQKGEFSNGITTIQCMYAPEFTSHSEGIRVTVQ